MSLPRPENAEKNTSERKVTPPKKRHLVFLCEVEPRQDYTCRTVKPGCDRFVPHSTFKTNETDTKQQPWFSVCPKCDKKARMANRTVMEYPTRHEAVEAAALLTLERQQRQEGA